MTLLMVFQTKLNYLQIKLFYSKIMSYNKHYQFLMTLTRQKICSNTWVEDMNTNKTLMQTLLEKNVNFPAIHLRYSGEMVKNEKKSGTLRLTTVVWWLVQSYWLVFFKKIKKNKTKNTPEVEYIKIAQAYN